ncbi:hypothetical protein OnM2_050062, partial [Erysiphe neolycopersici]
MISLNAIIQENPTKSISDCFKIMNTKLGELRTELPIELQIIPFMRSKIMLACTGVEHCQATFANPPKDLGNLISRFASSIRAKEAIEKDSSTYWTDRRFHRQYTPNKNYSATKSFHKPRCYVCNKDNCRSWRHNSEEEKETARKHHVNHKRFKNFDKSSPKFRKRFDPWLCEYEGDAAEEEYKNAFALDTKFGEENMEYSIETEHSDFEFADSHYLTSVGDISIKVAIETTKALIKNAFKHSILAKIEHKNQIDNSSPINSRQEFSIQGSIETDRYQSTSFLSTSNRYGSDKFAGFLIDTGVAKHSSVGEAQIIAQQKLDQRIKINDLNKNEEWTVLFGIGESTAKRITTVSTAIGNINFYIFNTKTPFLISLEDLKIPIIIRWGHAFLPYIPTLATYLIDAIEIDDEAFLTDKELSQLHRRFGHPSAKRLSCILERTGHDSNEEFLHHLNKICHHYDDIDFNAIIIVDIFYISENGKSLPVIHVLDEATRFQSGELLKNETSQEVGPPEMIVTYAGKNLTSKEFQYNTQAMSISVKTVPVEAHNSIGIVERYHKPIRRAYLIIRQELPNVSKQASFRMAFKAINDTAGPRGLVPTLLVFGSYCRINGSGAPAMSVEQRANAYKRAMEEVRKLRADRQIRDALNTRNGQIISTIKSLPLQSKVLVWREGNLGKKASWKGPYTLLGINGNTCLVQLHDDNERPTEFRIISVKPYFDNPDKQVNKADFSNALSGAEEQSKGADNDKISLLRVQPKRSAGRPSRYAIYFKNEPIFQSFLQSDLPKDGFKNSRQIECTGICKRMVTSYVTRDQIPQGTKIYKS